MMIEQPRIKLELLPAKRQNLVGGNGCMSAITDDCFRQCQSDRFSNGIDTLLPYNVKSILGQAK
jgi:hypothetical protein